MTGKTQTPEQNQRRFTRIEFDRPAVLETGGRTLTTRVLDISLRGVLVERPDGWDVALGDTCTVVVALGDADDGIRMEGTVANQSEGRMGIRCERIDVDSSTRLRRLVELNLGDPAMLDRELAALV